MPNTNESCRQEGCSRPANGGKRFCARHYVAWRKGKLAKGRFKTCRVESCRKRLHARGRCAEHFAHDFPGKKPAETAAEAPQT